MILRNLGSNAKTCATALACLLVLLMISAPTIAQDSDQAESDNSADTTQTATQTATQAATQAAEPRKVRNIVPSATPHLEPNTSIVETGSAGMYIPFDGGSVRKFEKTLEEVQEQTTPEEFTTVQNALDYLLVYDLSARRDKKTLYKNLDGKTPAEVVDMVKWRLEGRPGKRGR